MQADWLRDGIPALMDPAFLPPADVLSLARRAIDSTRLWQALGNNSEPTGTGRSVKTQRAQLLPLV
jgi:hypothetical protein